jgi:beta-lactamase regulating signal transducer with metallopeptidase domain
MVASLDIKAVAETLVLHGVNSLVISAVVAPFVLILLWLLPRSAAGRFAVWFSALLAIAVFPWIDVGSAGHISSRSITSARAAITAPAAWAVYLFAAWLGIAVLGLARLGWALWKVHELRTSFAPLEPSLLDSGMRAKIARQQQQRAVMLSTSDRVSVPTAVGLVKPAVVIPCWLMKELSPAELNQVLLHELAHLQRWDDWTNLAQKIVKALLFFHPAVWWIERKLSLEREMACDDVVLAESGSPKAYAACLVHLAQKSVMQRSLALAQAAVGRVRQTSLRVAQILSGDRAAARSEHGWKFAVALVSAFAVACLAGVARAPQLVAFNDLQPRIVAASSTPTARVRFSNPPIVPAKLSTDAPPVRANSKLTRPRVIEAKSVTRSLRPGLADYARSDLGQTRPSKTAEVNLVHCASLRRNANVTQTVFVVVEQDEYGSSGRAVHGVSVWYILLVQSPTPSGQGIPRKET